ncbi:MAG: M28 family peptidase [Spirosomataceae bacterium]
MKAQEIVETLAQFPHRAVASTHEQKVLAFLKSLFSHQTVTLQEFKTPTHYISVLFWLLGGICLGLVMLNVLPIVGAGLVLLFGVMALLYLNWYDSPVTKFPPLVTSYNLLVGPKQQHNATKKLILMAHYDTAPISFLYHPTQVGNFRSSLIFSLVLMILAIVLSVGVAFGYAPEWVLWITNALLIYFVGQGILSTLDFFRFGYSNGASDNATGVAAAITTAQRLWNTPPTDVEVELVLTGAEEVGMIGALHYFKKYRAQFPKETYLINFDTLGAGSLKVITQTGSLTNIRYQNKLITVAKTLLQQPDFEEVTTGSWHTADFDSVWFQRAGIPSVTLAALDQNGKMPRIHRPEDVLEWVDFSPMELSIELAEQMARQL